MTALAQGQYFGRVADRWTAGPLSLAVVVHDRKRANACHAHETPFLTLMLDGQYTETAARRALAFDRFSAIYHPPEFEHQDFIGTPGVRLLIFEFRPDLLEGTAVDRTRFRSLRDVSGSSAAWRLLSLYRTAASVDDALDFESDALELVASVAPLTGARREIGSLQRARDYVHAHFRDRITMREIASAAGVHPVHLGQSFRRELGETVSNCVTRLRVRAAAEQLAATDAPLATIALDNGFYDQSHLTRAFKRLSGLTPAAFRTSFSPEVA